MQGQGRRIREAIAEVLGDCPDDVADRFIQAFDEPAEQLAARAVLVLDKPYGRNHVLVAEGTWGLSFAQMSPNTTTSLHYHSLRREFFCMRRGVVTVTFGAGSVVLGRCESAASTPGEPHALRNEQDQPAEFLEIFTPALLEDKCRVSDPYQRRLGRVGVRE